VDREQVIAIGGFAARRLGTFTETFRSESSEDRVTCLFALHLEANAFDQAELSKPKREEHVLPR
jgi:hypothetical protein